MRITYQSPDALVIRDSAAVIRTVGVVLALLSAGMIARGVDEWGPNGGVTAGLVIGALCLLAGALLTLLPRTATFAFDKSQRLFIVTRRGLLRQPVREMFPLRDVAGIELEGSTDSDGGTTYRIATVLADGTRRPWTVYYSSGRVGKARIVNSAREFLGLPPGPGLAAPAATLTAAQQRTGGCLLVAMAIFCLIFLGFGGRMAWVQHRRLTTYAPVPVTVLNTSVEEVSGDDGSTYRPVITYRYEVAGRTYMGSRVTPLNESRGRRWAQAIADRFAAGERHTGYYDPARPSESFLVRRSSIFPYLFMAVPALILAFVATAMVANRRSGRA